MCPEKKCGAYSGGCESVHNPLPSVRLPAPAVLLIGPKNRIQLREALIQLLP